MSTTDPYPTVRTQDPSPARGSAGRARAGTGRRGPTQNHRALVIAVAQDLGIEVAYLPGLTMRRVAHLHPGQAKTDTRDAFIIAGTARTMAHTLHGITLAEESIAELSMLCGFDDDLASQITQDRNRLRGFLTQILTALDQ